MKKPDFYILWLIYFIGAGAGLMVIGSVAGMAKASMGELAFLVVAILAIGNASGRIIAGIISDKIGRSNTLIVMLLFQAVLMFAAIPIMGSETISAVFLVLLTTFIGFNYGTNLSLFPSYTKDLWGLKNFGINYGIIFTAWGVGGFVMGRMSQMLKASTSSFSSSFMTAGILLVIGAVLTFVLKARLAKQGLTQKRVA
jgi:nitrate/nitrite transporter NarK